MELNLTEKHDMIDLAKTNQSFYDVWKQKLDITEYLFSELREIMYGRIPRNFVINIKGNIGRQTGIFKSSMGCQIALDLDPTFNVEERVGFTPNQLLDKIKMYAKTKQIYLLDERVRDFKMSG